MKNLRIALAAAALVVFGSFGAQALPASGARQAATGLEVLSPVEQVQGSGRCFNRCIRGKRYRSCQKQEDKPGCCSQRCSGRRR